MPSEGDITPSESFVIPIPIVEDNRDGGNPEEEIPEKQ
jgi:hypothetical protein